MKFLKIIKSLLLLSICGIAFANTTAPTAKKVLILQVADHPALQQTTQGIIDELAAKGFIAGDTLTLRVESAQANAATALQIANKFVAQQPSVVVGVGTIAAQSFVKYTQSGRTQLVFSSVTDPLGAKLAAVNDKNMPNISGVSNFVPLEPQLKLIKTLQPQLQNLGIIYNPGEVNSVQIVKQLEQACNALNIRLHKQAIAKTTDAVQATTKLASNVEAIFISNDNTALSSLQSIVRAALQAQVPVYVSDTDAVESGAIAALGPNQYDLGKQTGAMVAKVLKGADINNLPVEYPANTELVINFAIAQKLGIKIPADLAAKAKNIGNAA